MQNYNKEILRIEFYGGVKLSVKRYAAVQKNLKIIHIWQKNNKIAIRIAEIVLSTILFFGKHLGLNF